MIFTFLIYKGFRPKDLIQIKEVDSSFLKAFVQKRFTHTHTNSIHK